MNVYPIIHDSIVDTIAPVNKQLITMLLNVRDNVNLISHQLLFLINPISLNQSVWRTLNSIKLQVIECVGEAGLALLARQRGDPDIRTRLDN